MHQENITKHYKVTGEAAYDDINTEAQTISHRLGLAKRMGEMAKKEAFITLKDHKGNFLNTLPCRLINPAKNEMGFVSKHILGDINGRLKKKLDVVLWKNSAAVIEWFRLIEQKENCTFMSFDIVEFYPSISETILSGALSFVREYNNILDEELEVIYHSRKSLLFKEDRAWMKKNSTRLFDVTIESYNGAEVCELVEIFAQAHLAKQFNP